MGQDIELGWFGPIRRFRWSAILLSLLIVLASCGGGDQSTDDEGHRFATERRPTQTPEQMEQTEPTEEAASTIVVAEPTPALFNLRGAPRVIYLQINDEIQAYDTSTREFTSVELGDGVSIVDFAASPTGDRVGVLLQQDHAFYVQFFGADGKAIGDAISIQNFVSTPGLASPIVSPSATPQAGSLPVVFHASWVPQGNALLVSGPGAIVHVGMNGAVMPVSREGVLGTVVEAFWSPMDSQVAIHTRMMNGEHNVFMLNAGHDEAVEVEAFHDHQGAQVANLQWMPSGLGMVLVSGHSVHGDLMNGQLYVYLFSDPTPTLIATSAQGGPSGTISHVAISPDGESVAYAVSVRDGNSWRLHSLWLRPTTGGQSRQIDLTSSAALVSLQWSAEGLVWQQADGTIMVSDGETPPRVLGTEYVPEATPVATPEATPVSATPAG